MYFYHIYPLFTLQLLSDSNHISPPTLGCFSKVYWVQVMVSLLYIWVLGHLLRHEHPNGGHFLEENWHSLLQHPPSAKVSQLGAGLYKPSSHLCWILTGLILCWSCAGNFSGRKSLNFLLKSSKVQTNYVWAAPSKGTHGSGTTYIPHLLFFKSASLFIDEVEALTISPTSNLMCLQTSNPKSSDLFTMWTLANLSKIPTATKRSVLTRWQFWSWTP